MKAYMTKNKSRRQKYTTQEVHSIEEEKLSQEEEKEEAKESRREMREADQYRDRPSDLQAKEQQVEEEGFERAVPKTQSDWTIVILFWCNFIMLTIFLIVNIASFTPVWIPFV